MIPILYDSSITVYLNNGLGRLSDAVSCQVEEELNGIYELKMTYPINGIHYSDIEEDRIILAEPFEGGTWQPFRIYKISRPMNGLITIYAEHISYLLNKIVVMPYTAGSCAQAISFLKDHCANDCPFTFMTDKSVTGAFKVEYPRSARGLLGGEQGSILDIYGKGEYEFDRFTVKLLVNRGVDNGVTIRYGKNLTDLVRDSDIGDVYTGIVPYWKNEDTTVTLPENVIYSSHREEFANDIIKAVDFSSVWTNEPTIEQLRAEAERYVASNENWKIKENIEISFAALWQTEEYKNIANIERVRMGDTVHVIYDALGVDVSAEVIRTVYDCLLGRYIKIELGAKKNSLGKTIAEQIAPTIRSETSSMMEQAIAHATALITGGNGGHVVIGTNADGQPNEIFIMDTDDAATAENVLRLNMNGIGFSSDGIDGPYETAWTLDGSFVANFITTGVLDANLIRAGIIRDLAGQNWWNLQTGEMHISAESYIDTSNFVTQADFDVAKGQIASQVIEQVGSGVLFNVLPIDSETTVTLQAHVFFNRTDVTDDFPPTFFEWYKKTEEGKEFIGTGYEITVTKSDYGYGGEVEAVFLMLETRYPVNSQGRWVFTQSGVNKYPVFEYDYE